MITGPFKQLILDSKGVGGNGYRLGALVYKKGYVLSMATNTTKTHPLMLKFGKYPYLHAEVHACIKAGLDNCKGAHMHVIRLKKDGTKGLAKPCVACQKFLKFVGIKSVFYSIDDTKGSGTWLVDTNEYL